MTAGLYLLSLLTADTSTGLASLYMFVLGAGIGASMQVLVIAVQNAVSYADLGAGTAGATFFRPAPATACPDHQHHAPARRQRRKARRRPRKRRVTLSPGVAFGRP